MIFEIGRIVLKTAGREAGHFAVVLDKVDDNFVLLTGPKSITRIKRRNCNIIHIEPLDEKLDIPAKADDSIVEDAWKKSGLIKKLKIELPKLRKTSKPKPEKPVKKLKENPVEPKKKEIKPKKK